MITSCFPFPWAQGRGHLVFKLEKPEKYNVCSWNESSCPNLMKIAKQKERKEDSNGEKGMMVPIALCIPGDSQPKHFCSCLVNLPGQGAC